MYRAPYIRGVQGYLSMVGAFPEGRGHVFAMIDIGDFCAALVSAREPSVRDRSRRTRGDISISIRCCF